jgi:hypothetical protein
MDRARIRQMAFVTRIPGSYSIFSVVCGILDVCGSTLDKAMYRNELTRVYELRDMAQTPPLPEAYFHDFDNKLRDSRVRLKHFRDIETELQGLDATVSVATLFDVAAGKHFD